MRKRHYVDFIFMIGLIGIFFITSLLVIVIGLKCYRQINEDSQKTYSIRTSLSYIQEKVKQMDEGGTIHVEAIEDSQGNKLKSLIIPQTIEGGSYVTYIYAYEHTLREYFLREGDSPRAEDGTILTNLQELSIDEIETEGKKVLFVRMMDEDGEIWKMYLHPQTEVSP